MASVYPASVRDVLAFHKLDRSVYDKLVALGTAPAVARNVVAFFMWLELTGVDILPHILGTGLNRVDVLRLVAEAEAIFDCLRLDAPSLAGAGDDSALAIPLIASLLGEPLDLRFFHCHRDAAISGIAEILEGVGAVIFDDRLHALLAAHEAAERRRKWKKPELPAVLSRPYDPRAAPTTPDDCRSMFITFSKGFPLKREDIAEYFTAKWGPCVERVMVEKTTTGAATPVYGRIVFTSEAYIGLVLNGKQLVKFTIKGRQLWARKYEPRKNAVVLLQLARLH